MPLESTMIAGVKRSGQYVHQRSRAHVFKAETAKRGSESELNFARYSVSPWKEVKNRGHLRVHAGSPTRALRKGATGRNMAGRPNSQRHIVLSRWYFQVGCNFPSVRKHSNG